MVPDRWTDGQIDGRTDPLIEMRGHIGILMSIESRPLTDYRVGLWRDIEVTSLRWTMVYTVTPIVTTRYILLRIAISFSSSALCFKSFWFESSCSASLLYIFSKEWWWLLLLFKGVVVVVVVVVSENR